MANITKYIVTGRRPESATALAPAHPWRLSLNPRHPGVSQHHPGSQAGPGGQPIDSRSAPRDNTPRDIGGPNISGRGITRRPRTTSPPHGDPDSHRRQPLNPPHGHRDHIPGLHGLLGEVAWRRLPATVRARFSEPIRRVDYIGEFDIVRASLLGRAIAWVCTLIGTPVVPRTGQGVGAIIHVGPVDRGASWLREYQWPDGRVCRVHSTKVIGADGTLVEELPAGLRMPLEVFERHGVLHFVSLGYYFDLGLRFGARKLKIPLPHWLSPGTTHVEHADETDGWFRFTMTVTHPLLGELFYQTGRFRAAQECEALPRIDDEQTNVCASWRPS